MTLHSIYKRLLAVVLLLLPDNRATTRRAVMRASVWMRKQNGTLTLEQRKWLTSKERKEYKLWISAGVGMLLFCVQHTMTLCVFFLIAGWWLWSAASWCLQKVTG